METADRKSSATAGAFTQLAIAWLTMFVIGSDLFVVSPLLPLISADYAVQPAAAGLSVTVFAVAYMLSAPLLANALAGSVFFAFISAIAFATILAVVAARRP